MKSNPVYGFLLAVVSLCGVEISAYAQTLKDPRDGKEYPTVKIGTKIWMAQNLAYEEPLDDEAKFFALFGNVKYYTMCYEDKLDHCGKYGMLYSWRAAQDACPQGWHVPKKEEVDSLIATLGEKNQRYVNLLHFWSEPTLLGGRVYAGEAAKFAGLRSEGLNKFGTFWTATEERDNYKYLFYVNKIHKTVRVNTSGGNIGASVRCLKND